MELTKRFGPTSEAREQRLRFLSIKEEDVCKLRSIHGLVEEQADLIIDRLSDHLLNFEKTRRHFTDPAGLARVKERQKRYFSDLTADRTDEAYFEDRLRVGDTHERIELVPHWYLGVYIRYFELIVEQLRERLGADRCIDVLSSLAKQMFLDIGLAMDAYIQGGFIEKLQSERQTNTDLREELARKEKLAILGQLVGGVGHELRNPMASMEVSIYFLRNALERSGSAKIDRHLQLLEQELARANEIITSLLDFSRVKEPETVLVPIAELLQEVLERYDWRTVRLVTSLEAAYLRIDPGQVKQIVGNVVTNAVQAMENGGQLTVTSRVEGAFVSVAVSDTGVGIPADAMQKIFQPLYTTKTTGIGLGLAVCDALIRANRGRIRVASQVGKGTIFTLEFPVEAIDGRSMAHPAR